MATKVIQFTAYVPVKFYKVLAEQCSYFFIKPAVLTCNKLLSCHILLKIHTLVSFPYASSYIYTLLCTHKLVTILCAGVHTVHDSF